MLLPECCYFRQLEIAGIDGLLFVNGDVGVDILGADEAVEQQISLHYHYEPVAYHVAGCIGDGALHQRHDAAAYNHHHEDA